MINTEIFIQYALSSVDSTYPQLKPTAAQRTLLRKRIEAARSAQERVGAFENWVREVQKAQVTP